MRATILFLHLLVLACSPRGRFAPTSGAIPKDVQFFEAALAAFQKAHRAIPQVDPRPVQLSSGDRVTAISLLGDSSADLAHARRQVIRELQLREIDAVLVGFNERCPSSWRGGGADVDSARRAEIYRGCPRDDIHVLVMGVARHGSSSAGKDGYDEDQGEPMVGYSAIQVARSLLGPGGAELQVFDYVFRVAANRKPEFVRAVLLYVLE